MAQTNGQEYTATYPQERVIRPGQPELRPYRPPQPAPAERPIGDLFQELGQDISNLVSLELALAKTELAEKAGQAGKAAGFVGAGGFILYAGFLAILAAVIAVLALVIPLWLSALIVGVVVAVIGYVLVRKGLNDLKPENLTPKQTLDSLKEDKEWAQNVAH
jgi:hypothetical protein